MGVALYTDISSESLRDLAYTLGMSPVELFAFICKPLMKVNQRNNEQVFLFIEGSCTRH